MKKLLLVAAAATALTATPAMADNNVSIVTTATVAPVCEASALVRQTAGDNSTAIDIGYDPTTQSTTTTTATSTVNLGLTTPQLLGSLTARCNSGTATITLDTANGFKLVNGAGGDNREVPFALNLSGGGGASGITSTHTGTIGGTGPGTQQSRSLNFVLASAVNPLSLVPGPYNDTITATFTPNP